MRQRTQLKLAAGMLALLILALVAVLIVFAMKRGQNRESLVSQLVAQTESTPEPVVDPFARREADAVIAVQRLPSGAAGQTVRQRIDSGIIEQALPYLEPLGLPEPEWVGRRIADTSVYEVRYRYTYHGVRFGPRWLVQLDPAGLVPADAIERALPTNATAKLIHTEDVESLSRYYDRADEVLGALTEHRFPSGLRLPSSLLIFFAGRQDAVDVDDVLGWLVVPETIDPDGEITYRVYFQWKEDERLEDAVWQVSYRNNTPSFRPRDRRAEEIMTQGSDLDADSVIDIRPMTMRDDADPQSEGQDCRRAIRYLLRDARIMEGVGTLLSFRARNAALEYKTWHVDYAEGTRDRCIVEYKYDEAGVERAVGWEVAHSDGTRYPVNELSTLAERVVSLRVLPLPTGE
jgi:hypothetical protein